jgi:hypothetical protein
MLSMGMQVNFHCVLEHYDVQTVFKVQEGNTLLQNDTSLKERGRERERDCVCVCVCSRVRVHGPACTCMHVLSQQVV